MTRVGLMGQDVRHLSNTFFYIKKNQRLLLLLLTMLLIITMIKIKLKNYIIKSNLL